MPAIHAMNVDIFTGRLRQLLGQVRVHAGKMLGSERQIAQGQNDQHIGLLQQAYGAARHKAQAQTRHFKAHDEDEADRQPD